MNKKSRIAGLDLLRIISMFGIVGLHVINQGGIIKNANIYSVNYYVLLVLLIFFFTSVDTFAILSGYLNIDKEKNRHVRIVELISIVMFYCLVIPIIYYAFNPERLKGGYKEIIFNFFPILAGNYWYITNYTLLFFLIPFINKLCKSLDKKSFKNMLIIFFIFLSIIPNLFFEMVDLFKVCLGYSAFWLIYLYMIGAYIKLYGFKMDLKKSLKYFIIFFSVTLVINIVIRNIQYMVFKRIINGEFLIDYISPLTVVLAILLLLIFRCININNNRIKKVITFFSTASFSVYIMHGHRIIFYNYFTDSFVPLLKFNCVALFLAVLATIMCIYVICSILDEIRKLIYKIFKIDKVINLLGEKIDKILK